MTSRATGRGAPERVFALLSDGEQVEIRRITERDGEAVRALHAGLSDESLYRRFFALNRAMADRLARRLCRAPGPDHAALGAWSHGELVGVAEYEPADVPGEAELALAVADRMQHRGVGTLLLEHLGSLARANGMAAFRADSLAENTPMLRVFADAGLPARRRATAGVVELTLPLTSGDTYLDAVAERERSADVASLRALLRPRAVAVVGASRRDGTVGAAILENLRLGGFEGTVHAVNPHAAGRTLHGAACVASPAELPERPDLAVIAVPAAAVVDTADQCGHRGARGLVVVSSALTAAQGAELLAVCRAHGMRLVGPNCLGIADSGTRLDATFAASRPGPGVCGVVVQSGGIGIALIEQLSRLGIGVSSFASVGDKYDVSSNDMLMWWESDETTRLGIMHMESFGNPRKFARTARRVSARMPLLTILAGRSAAGERAAASHTAAAATPELTRRALFEQAGIIATDDLGELVDTAALLACSPLPAGPRVAIVSNAGGAGVLAADACADAGLSVSELGPAVRGRLGDLLPAAAATANPVDTTAGIPAERYARAVETVAADESVDALVVLVVPTALGDLRAAVPRCDKPVAMVDLGQAENVVVRTDKPVYPYPERAVRALANAWSYARRKNRESGTRTVPPGIRPDRANAIIGAFLAGHEDGGWLPPAETFRLLEAYGLPLAPWRLVHGEEAAAGAFAELTGPVVLKADVPGVLHKRAAGGVRLGLRDEAAVRAAHRELAARFGARLRGVVVQAMAADGVEVLCGAVQEEVFGPVVVFGAGGVDADALADRTARLAPLTDADADELVHGVRLSPLLLGHPGRPAGDVAALKAALTRLSRLAADHAQIAELDLNPTIVRPDGVVAVDARVHLTPRRTWDPYLRRLR
ncbi:bifunctional GNAT family N-acetyltransferase/acetate--CoA ligase family protein [Actinomadura sp. WMMB 499]|uniref:bifunctional acetate--CoA ligase family protein/GNAT family N-acetyltransferase n=1 Tax=Actinomadura sp. WMMB 499 TaxID=1219491 RepID=UPI0012487808|nr:bifunctional GNAT family N-acetyltransferase/acetate--CoA ligase family protein [Actinomadura sp. WMMB 499]QFG21271.1 GNAT family N-acetyltransferase [Actinomadura sp. WMMB 499]